MIENLVITKIYLANSIEHRSYINHFKKNRAHNALFFKVQGETVYTHNGIEYTANNNNCVFLPKGIDYSFEIKELGLCYFIEFDILNNEELQLPQTFRLTHPENIIERLKKTVKYWNSSECTNAKRMYELYRIISDISAQDKTDYSIKSKAKAIEKSLEYINKNYLNTDISNVQLADISNISEVYFRKIFTNLYGISPKRYIIGLRVKKAEELLSSDYSTVEDVALSSGFTNVYHFIKTFKSITGYTPTEYSVEHSKSNPSDSKN